jgi:dihydrofolate reductase
MINALFAVDQYGGMGFNGTMPWPHNSADLKNFKELTTGHVVVMGRKTWDDKNMPKPLKGRTTYVATHQPFLQHTAVIKGDLNKEILALEQKHPGKIIWVVGGPELLEQCGEVFDRLYLTHYKGSFKIDTRLNMKKFLTGWSPKTATADPNTNFTTVVYESLFKRITRSPE